MAVAGAAAAGAAAGLLLRAEPVPPPPPASLVQPGTSPLMVREADLDGDGQVEVAVSSVSAAREGAEIPVPRLEVFDHRDGHWVLVLDASTDAPPGAEGAPRSILVPPGAAAPGQVVQVMEAVDFAGDGVPELVLGVLTIGATAGPLELWVISMEDDTFRTELYEKTERGGRVMVKDRGVVLEHGVFRPDDPGCCPSGLARERIRWDEATGRIVSGPEPAP